MPLATPDSFAAKWPHVASERSAIIFVDVLCATTTLNAALACSCRGISLAVKTQGGTYDLTPPTLPHESWLLGGEEDGRPIAGGAFDNSPPSVIAAD
jgi:phosphosulfolactate phosphohydrolase-like enzyme